MNMSSYLMSSSSFAASSPIASRASVRLGSRMKIAASSFDAASASRVELKDAYLGGLKEKQQEDCRMIEKEIQEKLMILYLSHGIVSLLLNIMKLVGNHLQKDQQNSYLQNSRKVTEHFLAILPHHVPYMNDVYDMVRKVYARPADDPMKDLDVNMATRWIFYECHSQSSNSSRKWPWREFEKCTKFFLDNYRTTFRWKRKVDQWSNRELLVLTWLTPKF